MRTFVASDNPAYSAKLRKILLREGQDCPEAHVLTLDGSANRLAGARAEMVVFVLSPNPERALAVLRELRLTSQVYVVAVGPPEPKLILRTMREGADEYLDESDLENEFQSALTRLHSEKPDQGEPGKLIAVLGPSGGCGASTLAANLAIVLAQQHKSCALFDLKLETGDLASLLDLKPTHTISDLCLNASRADRAMFERSLVPHASGVHLLAAPQRVADIRVVNPQGIRQAVTLARGMFPYVVADLDHSFREEQMQVLRQADEILLVFRLDFTALRNTRRTLDYLEQSGVNKDRVRLVVNRYGQPKELPAAKAEEALGVPITHYVPDDPKTINRANNNGIPAVLDAPAAKVSRSVAQLARSVNGKASG